MNTNSPRATCCASQFDPIRPLLPDQQPRQVRILGALALTVDDATAMAETAACWLALTQPTTPACSQLLDPLSAGLNPFAAISGSAAAVDH